MKGYKVDKGKLQYCLADVLYLGQFISKDGKRIIPDRAAAIRHAMIPKTVKDMQKFLGLFNYCCAWIWDYAAYTCPLLQALKEAQKSSAPIKWTQEMMTQYFKLKDLITHAPVLANPDYDREF
ncbi:uncharacterized protein [Ambystoma mexicanum]|uniref:uncharacterized protein n=1 Tax=Ambystoma mexicanum TaxID=8296 RepID=UPI0037E7CFF4